MLFKNIDREISLRKMFQAFQFISSPIYVYAFFSVDDCDGTGDHENYFTDIADAYEIDGTKYTDCRIKAISYRSKYEHKPLSRLIDNTFLLYNRVMGGEYVPLFQHQLLDKKEIIDPKYS